MPDAIHITITDCGGCPAMKPERHYTGDSFEMVFDWKCERNHGAIIAAVEWNDPKPAIPAWCPLRSNAKIQAGRTKLTIGDCRSTASPGMES